MLRYYKHQFQITTNRILEYSENQGNIRWILMPRYLSEDIGALFEHVRETLHYSVANLVRPVNFTMVNFFCNYSTFSRGYCPPPPSYLYFPATYYTLTFALRDRYYTKDTVFNKQFKLLYRNYAYLWGDDLPNKHSYYTICVLAPLAYTITHRPMLAPACFYYYNVLSILTKNYITNQYTEPFLDNMYNNRNKYYELTFADLIKRYSYKTLPFNKYVWFHATNLITRMLDYNAALFFLMYVFESLPLQSRTEGDLLLNIVFGTDQYSIRAQLAQSIELYNTQRDAENLLLVAALHGRECSGPTYFKDLKRIHYQSSYNFRPEDAIRILQDANVRAEAISGDGNV